MIFLTAAEVETLTGYRQPTRQVRWLRRHGLRVYVRADGVPMVPASQFAQQPQQPERATRPDFGALA